MHEWVPARPAAPLRPFISAYTGYRRDDDIPGTHRGLPSPYLTLIVTIDDPVRVLRHPDPAQTPGSYRTILGGLHTSPAIIDHPGRESGVQIGLSPLGARSLLGLPASELASIDLEADEVFGSDELHERVRAAGTWTERFAVIDEVLLRRFAPDAGASTTVTYAWRRLLDTGGTLAVAELARDIGWSPRHLSGRFRAEFGLTPKEAARVVRFDRARRQLTRAPELSLARIAAERGFYDQAHLDRDFRDFAGCAPTRWLAEEFRNVQAGADLLATD